MTHDNNLARCPCCASPLGWPRENRCQCANFHKFTVEGSHETLRLVVEYSPNPGRCPPGAAWVSSNGEWIRQRPTRTGTADS